MNKKSFVVYSDNCSIIANQIEIADSFFARFRGLLGRKNLAEGEGLLLTPCSDIHCFGMKFPIDVIFLDRQYRVLGIKENLRPGAMASNRWARHVLELKAGEAQKHEIHVGEQLIIKYNE